MLTGIQNDKTLIHGKCDLTLRIQNKHFVSWKIAPQKPSAIYR